MSDSESSPSDIEEIASQAISTLLPEKSKERYEAVFNKYESWCQRMESKNITNENILLSYFSVLSKECKPSSLMAFYSMIRSVISVKKNVDISKYTNLLTFIKKKSEGFQPKKSKTLSKSEITKFLLEAEDDKFLFMKVALIVGFAGACRKKELTELTVNDVKDKGEYYHISVLSSKSQGHRHFLIPVGDIDGVNLVHTIRKYVSLRPKNVAHDRFFIQFRDKKCTKQPVGINTFAALPKHIASFLKLETPEKYTGNCMRRSSTSLLAKSGANILTIKRQCGLKSNIFMETVENSLENKSEITTNASRGCQIQNYMEVVPEPNVILENQPVNIVEVVMDYQATLENSNLATLQETEQSQRPADPAEFLLQKAKYHDCFITVGNPNSDQVETIGVAASHLAAHSPVFRLQLEDPKLVHENNMHITSMSPEVFKLMLTHVYGGELPEMVRSTAIQLALSADTYKIPKLVCRACLSLVPTTVQDVFPALWCVAHIQCPDLEADVTKIIREDTEGLLETKEFLAFDSKCLDLVARQEQLSISELELWKALVKWGKSKAQADPSKTVRQHLNSALQFVRLSTLSLDEIIKEVLPTMILSLEEVTDLLTAIISNRPLQLPGLCSIQTTRELTRTSDEFGVGSRNSLSKISTFTVNSVGYLKELIEDQSFSSFTIKTLKNIYVETFTFRSRARSKQGDQPIYSLSCSVIASKIENGFCKESKTIHVGGLVVGSKNVSFPLKFRNGQLLKLESKSCYDVALRFTDPHPVYEFKSYNTMDNIEGNIPQKNKTSENTDKNNSNSDYSNETYVVV